MVVQIPDAQYWSPNDPFLYQASINLKNQQKISDDWHHRFGLRALTIKDQDFYLNEKRIYIKATFFEGLYPNGIAHPDSEEMVRKEIRLAKEAGFNMIRPWRHPMPPMWLDLADEMGVMVSGQSCFGMYGVATVLSLSSLQGQPRSRTNHSQRPQPNLYRTMGIVQRITPSGTESIDAPHGHAYPRARPQPLDPG